MSFAYSKIQTLDTHKKAAGFSLLFSLIPQYSVPMPLFAMQACKPSAGSSLKK